MSQNIADKADAAECGGRGSWAWTWGPDMAADSLIEVVQRLLTLRG